MSDIKEQFDAAAAASKNRKERPNNDTMLKVYAPFKQATVGDVEGKRPGFTDRSAAPSSMPGPRQRARLLTTRCVNTRRL